ncbi:MAG TPA: DUF4339 domain-containing protein, partial [Planctomycetaceae bacterium]
MREQWYCKIVGQEVGPVTSEDLLSMLDRGQIDLGDEVRAGTSGPWRRVSDVLGKPSRTPEPATVATASAESSGDEYGFLNDIARLEDAGGEAPPRSRRSSDDLLAGLADLEDADAPPAGPAAGRSSDELLAGLADLEDAGPPPPPAFVPPFAPAAPPADPAARAEMLRRLDAEYQRLRHQLAGGPPA